MAINFPTSLDNFTNPSSGNTLDSPSHSLQHSDINDAVEALEAKLGVGASPAGSATSGYVLMAGTGGTTTWSVLPNSGALVQIVPSAVTVGSGSGSVGTNGQVTFTGASSIAFNNVFSATYDSYKIILNVTSSSGSPSIRFRYRSGGTPNSSSAYAYAHTKNAYTTSNSADGGNTTSFAWSYYGVTPTTASYDVHAPFLNQYTGMVGQVQTSADIWHAGYKHTVTASYDGFEFYPDSGTITGLISIYGYRD